MGSATSSEDPLVKLPVNHGAQEQPCDAQDSISKDRDSSYDRRSPASFPASNISLNHPADADRSSLDLAIAHNVDKSPTPPIDRDSFPTELEEEFDAPPSSQSTPASEDEDAESVTSDSASEEELLAEFDVDSDDRQFLAEMLHSAPGGEVEKLQKARYEELDYDKPITDFAKSHPIYELHGGEVDEDALIQFRKDIYAFSRATGMTRKKAKEDSRRSVAAWVKYVALEDSVSSQGKFKVKEGAPHLTQAKDYYKSDKLSNQLKTKKKKKKKKGKKSTQLSSPAPIIADTTNIEATAIPVSAAGEKRKRASLESVVPQDEILEPMRDKRRRKRSRHLAHEVGEMEVDSAISIAMDKPATKSAKDQGNHATSNMPALPTQQTPAEPIKPKKMKPKPGPTASAYFAIPQTSLQEHASPRIVGSSLGSSSTVQTTRASRRSEKRRAAKMAAKGESSSVGVNAEQHPSPVHSTPASSDITSKLQVGTGPKYGQPEPLPSSIIDVAAESAISHPPPIDDPASKITNVHRNRKRKRNQNWLPADQIALGLAGVSQRRERHAQQVAQSDPSESPHPLGECGRPLEQRIRSFPPQQEPEEQNRASGEQENPLIELNNVNSSTKSHGRRDRGRGRKRSFLVEPTNEANDPQEAKDRHS